MTSPNNISSIPLERQIAAAESYAIAKSTNNAPSFVKKTMDRSVVVDNKGRPLTVDRLLGTKPLQEDLSNRPGAGNKQMTYLTGEATVRTLNEIFGYDGWNLSIIKHEKIDAHCEGQTKWFASYLSFVRITLANGSYREDVGVGDGRDRTLSAAVQHAIKSSVTDGMKRAARLFGDKLGNCLYGGTFSRRNAPQTLLQALNEYDARIEKRYLLTGNAAVGGGGPSAAPAAGGTTLNAAPSTSTTASTSTNGTTHHTTTMNQKPTTGPTVPRNPQEATNGAAANASKGTTPTSISSKFPGLGNKSVATNSNASSAGIVNMYGSSKAAASTNGATKPAQSDTTFASSSGTISNMYKPNKMSPTHAVSNSAPDALSMGAPAFGSDETTTGGATSFAVSVSNAYKATKTPSVSNSTNANLLPHSAPDAPPTAAQAWQAHQPNRPGTSHRHKRPLQPSNNNNNSATATTTDTHTPSYEYAPPAAKKPSVNPYAHSS